MLCKVRKVEERGLLRKGQKTHGAAVCGAGDNVDSGWTVTEEQESGYRKCVMGVKEAEKLGGDNS